MCVCRVYPAGRGGAAVLHLPPSTACVCAVSTLQDVVVLQEVWVDRDAQLLMAAGQQGGLVHSMHFRSGIFGSGLVTLSRQADHVMCDA